MNVVNLRSRCSKKENSFTWYSKEADVFFSMSWKKHSTALSGNSNVSSKLFESIPLNNVTSTANISGLINIFSLKINGFGTLQK